MTIAFVFLLVMVGASMLGQLAYWKVAGGTDAADVAQVPTANGQVASAEYISAMGLVRPGAPKKPWLAQALDGTERIYPPHARLGPEHTATDGHTFADVYRNAGWDYKGRIGTYTASRGNIAVRSFDHYPYNGTIVVSSHPVWWGMCACWLPGMIAAASAALAWRRRWRWDRVVLVILGMSCVPQLVMYVLPVVHATGAGPPAQADAFYSELLMAPGFAVVPRAGLLTIAMWLAGKHSLWSR